MDVEGKGLLAAIEILIRRELSRCYGDTKPESDQLENAYLLKVEKAIAELLRQPTLYESIVQMIGHPDDKKEA